MHAAGLYHYALHLIQDQEEESLTPEPKYLKEMSHLDRQKKKEEIFGHLGQVEVQLLRLLGVERGLLSELACLARAQEETLRNRENLQKRRSLIEGEIDKLGEEPKPEQVRAVHRLVAEEMRNFTAQLIEQCMKILGDPPCGYAIIGLGSMSREEMTPYSDLEFAILIKEEGEGTKNTLEI